MPRISIIVPVYKAQTYLNRCVDSILAQTFVDFELILVDDGSPDNCPAICDEYVARDNRVHVIHQSNKGVAYARNIGISIANGDYIAFCDSDDFWESDFLDKTFNENYDLNICGCYFCDATGKVVKIARQEMDEVKHVSKENMLLWFERGSMYSVWTCIFKKSIIQKYDMKFNCNTSRGEDTIFMLEYTEKCETVRFISNILYNYVRYGGETLTTTRKLNNIISLDYIDTYLDCWLSKNNFHSTVFYDMNFWTHKELLDHFFAIYSDHSIRFEEKIQHYNAFWKTSARKKYCKKWFEKERIVGKMIFLSPSPILLILYEFYKRITKGR